MWSCYVLSCDFAWNAGCTVAFRTLGGDMLGMAQWTVGARVKDASVLRLTRCDNGEELETVYGGDLVLKAESIVRQKGRTADSPYHIKLLYQGNILREESMLSGRDMSCPLSLCRVALPPHPSAGPGLLENKPIVTVRARTKMALAEWRQNCRLRELRSH